MAKLADGNMYLKPKEEPFTTFIWNSEKRQFLGRTGASWAKISIFYVIFYSCLAGFFAAMLAIFYQTLDTQYRPKYAFGSSILANPALGFRPRPAKDNVESTLIWFRNANVDSSHWINELNSFIDEYHENKTDVTKVRTCNFEDYREEREAIKSGRALTEEEKENMKKYCSFNDTWLSEDQSFKNDPRKQVPRETIKCSKNDSWGYADKAPCVLLKMNRIIDWEPNVYTAKDVTEGKLPPNMPAELKKHLQEQVEASLDGLLPEMVWLSCQGENPADKEYLPNIDMFPVHGFPAYYFPYDHNPAYKSPVVAVQFSEPEANVLINIECRVWAKNIKHDSQNRLGMVHFELLRD